MTKHITDMQNDTIGQIEYMERLLQQFGDHFHITPTQACRYLYRYGAFEPFVQHYHVLHTLSFEDNIEGLAAYCHRKGGQLI